MAIRPLVLKTAESGNIIETENVRLTVENLGFGPQVSMIEDLANGQTWSFLPNPLWEIWEDETPESSCSAADFIHASSITTTDTSVRIVWNKLGGLRLQEDGIRLESGGWLGCEAGGRVLREDLVDESYASGPSFLALECGGRLLREDLAGFSVFVQFELVGDDIRVTFGLETQATQPAYWLLAPQMVLEEKGSDDRFHGLILGGETRLNPKDVSFGVVNETFPIFFTSPGSMSLPFMMIEDKADEENLPFFSWYCDDETRTTKDMAVKGTGAGVLFGMRNYPANYATTFAKSVSWSYGLRIHVGVGGWRQAGDDYREFLIDQNPGWFLPRYEDNTAITATAREVSSILTVAPIPGPTQVPGGDNGTRWMCENASMQKTADQVVPSFSDLNIPNSAFVWYLYHSPLDTGDFENTSWPITDPLKADWQAALNTLTGQGITNLVYTILRNWDLEVTPAPDMWVDHVGTPLVKTNGPKGFPEFDNQETPTHVSLADRVLMRDRWVATLTAVGGISGQYWDAWAQVTITGEGNDPRFTNSSLIQDGYASMVDEMRAALPGQAFEITEWPDCMGNIAFIATKENFFTVAFGLVTHGYLLTRVVGDRWKGYSIDQTVMTGGRTPSDVMTTALLAVEGLKLVQMCHRGYVPSGQHLYQDDDPRQLVTLTDPLEAIMWGLFQNYAALWNHASTRPFIAFGRPTVIPTYSWLEAWENQSATELAEDRPHVTGFTTDTLPGRTLYLVTNFSFSTLTFSDLPGTNWTEYAVDGSGGVTSVTNVDKTFAPFQVRCFEVS